MLIEWWLDNVEVPKRSDGVGYGVGVSGGRVIWRAPEIEPMTTRAQLYWLEIHRETSRNIPRVNKNIRRAIALYTSVWFILCTYLFGKEYSAISLYFPDYLKWFYTSRTCIWRIHKMDIIILLARFWIFMDKWISSTNIAKFTLGNVTGKLFI